MTGNNEWFKPLAAAALARFDAVMDTLGLSGGKNSGREYLPLNPKRDDHSPGSFSIHRDKGAWMDGATGDKGGDLISLAAYLWDCGNGEAAERLGKQLGIDVPEPPEWRQKQRKGRGDTPARGRLKSYPANRASRRRMMTACASCRFLADAPPRRRCTRGTASRPARWVYVDAAGAVLFHHCRFEPPGERKQFAPLSLWKMAGGRMVWKWKAPSEPRPLLGLDRLAALPNAPVVVTEGEKAHDAAALLLPDAVIVTWQGGSNAVDKSDWLPLAGARGVAVGRCRRAGRQGHAECCPSPARSRRCGGLAGESCCLWQGSPAMGRQAAIAAGRTACRR
jgi:putative DNA primase/helicase